MGQVTCVPLPRSSLTLDVFQHFKADCRSSCRKRTSSTMLRGSQQTGGKNNGMPAAFRHEAVWAAVNLLWYRWGVFSWDMGARRGALRSIGWAHQPPNNGHQGIMTSAFECSSYNNPPAGSCPLAQSMTEPARGKQSSMPLEKPLGEGLFLATPPSFISVSRHCVVVKARSRQFAIKRTTASS